DHYLDLLAPIAARNDLADSIRDRQRVREFPALTLPKPCHADAEDLAARQIDQGATRGAARCADVAGKSLAALVPDRTMDTEPENAPRHQSLCSAFPSEQAIDELRGKPAVGEGEAHDIRISADNHVRLWQRIGNRQCGD